MDTQWYDLYATGPKRPQEVSLGLTQLSTQNTWMTDICNISITVEFMKCIWFIAWMFDWIIHRLIDWLIDKNINKDHEEHLTGWLIEGLLDWSIDLWIDWLTNWLIDELIKYNQTIQSSWRVYLLYSQNTQCQSAESLTGRNHTPGAKRCKYDTNNYEWIYRVHFGSCCVGERVISSIL